MVKTAASSYFRDSILNGHTNWTFGNLENYWSTYPSSHLSLLAQTTWSYNPSLLSLPLGLTTGKLIACITFALLIKGEQPIYSNITVNSCNDYVEYTENIINKPDLIVSTCLLLQ